MSTIIEAGIKVVYSLVEIVVLLKFHFYNLMSRLQDILYETLSFALRSGMHTLKPISFNPEVLS